MGKSEIDALLLRAMIATLFLSGTMAGSETRILNAIIADTLLIGKERARITQFRLSELSGLTRTGCGAACNALIKKGYVVKDEGALRLDVDAMQADSEPLMAEFTDHAA